MEQKKVYLYLRNRGNQQFEQETGSQKPAPAPKAAKPAPKSVKTTAAPKVPQQGDSVTISGGKLAGQTGTVAGESSKVKARTRDLVWGQGEVWASCEAASLHSSESGTAAAGWGPWRGTSIPTPASALPLPFMNTYPYP